MKLGLGLGINKGGFVKPNLFRDATLAFSLRDLGLGAGDIIEVRRDSNNDFDRFTADQINNGSVESFTNGLGLVTWWKEQNGSANDAIQNTSTKQPIIVDSSANLVTENGKPSILVTGSQNMLVSNLNYDNTDNISVYTVGKYSNTNSNAKYIYNLTDAGARLSDNFIGNRSFNNNFTSFINNSTNTKLNDITPSDINFNLFVDKLNNGNFIKKINTVENTITGYPQFSPTKLFLFSAGNSSGFHEGKVSEFIVFRQQDAPTDIEKNINNYYGIY